MTAPLAGLRRAVGQCDPLPRRRTKQDWARLEQIVTQDGEALDPRAQRRRSAALCRCSIGRRCRRCRWRATRRSTARWSPISSACARAPISRSTACRLRRCASSPASSPAPGPRRCGRCGARPWSASLLTFGAALVAYLLIRSDPTWFYSIIPQGLADGPRSVGLGGIPAGDALRQRRATRTGLGAFATFLFTHNSQIAIFAFALRLRLRRADRPADPLQRA